MLLVQDHTMKTTEKVPGEMSAFKNTGFEV